MGQPVHVCCIVYRTAVSNQNHSGQGRQFAAIVARANLCYKYLATDLVVH